MTNLTPSFYDTEREEDLVGLIVEYPDILPKVTRECSRSDFGEQTGRVFDVLCDIQADDETIDPFTIRDRLNDERLMLKVLDWRRATGFVAQAGVFHARKIRALSVLRQVRDVGVDLTGIDPTGDPSVIVRAAITALHDAGKVVPISWVRMSEATIEAELQLEESYRAEHTIPTGLPTLDRYLNGGLQPGQLYVIGARPGIGKSALATNIARQALEAGRQVLFASIEMDSTEVISRFMTERFDIDMHDPVRLIARWNRDDVQGWPFVFTGDPELTDIVGVAEALEEEHLRLVVVDYLQLVQTLRWQRETKRGFDRRDLELAYITAQLKHLARRLRVAVLALSQISRAGAGSDAPRLHHLRESGAIEQDADVVMILHRNKDDLDKRHEAELTVAKNRHGHDGTISLRFIAPRVRFVEIDTRFTP